MFGGLVGELQFIVPEENWNPIMSIADVNDFFLLFFWSCWNFRKPHNEQCAVQVLSVEIGFDRQFNWFGEFTPPLLWCCFVLQIKPPITHHHTTLLDQELFPWGNILPCWMKQPCLSRSSTSSANLNATSPIKGNHQFLFFCIIVLHPTV